MGNGRQQQLYEDIKRKKKKQDMKGRQGKVEQGRKGKGKGKGQGKGKGKMSQ